MIDDPHWLNKLIGSALGSISALVFIPPPNTKIFWRRIVVSLIAGALIGNPLIHYFDFMVTPENVIAASFIAALFSWTTIGAGYRVLDLWKGPGRR